MHTTECPNGPERLTQQQMTDLVSLLSRMAPVIESLQDFDRALIKDCLLRSSERFVLNLQMSLRRLSQDLLTQFLQTRLSLSSQLLREERDTSTSSANKL